MAATSHGFYGLGSSKTANFGLAANMTLPIVHVKKKGDGDAGYSATMPHEKKKMRKKARFAVEPLDEDVEQPAEQEVILRNPTKKPSWRSRVSNMFKRNSKLEKEADEEQRNVAVPDPENDPPQVTVDDMEVEKRKAAKKKRRKKRDTKSRSTAFEETTNMPYLLSNEMHNTGSDFLKLAIRPQSASNELLVTLKRQSDGFGIHLSGGLPPISVTYVQPGSEAESARIMVGDIVTEVNGHDCRKGVGISQIMELKSLIQQAPSDHEDSTVDDGEWQKIKAQQEKLDTDKLDIDKIDTDSSDDNEITNLDESSDSEVEQPAPKVEPSPKIEPEPKAKSPSEDKPSSTKSSSKAKSKIKPKASEESPLVKTQQKAKSPDKTEQPPEMETPKLEKESPKSSTPKKKVTKKKKKQSDIDSEVSPIKSTDAETPPLSHVPSVEDLPNASPNLVTVGIIKRPKRTKKTGSEAAKIESVANDTSSLVETSANTSIVENSKEPAKKRRSKEPSPSSAMADTSAAIMTSEESSERTKNKTTTDDTPKKSENGQKKKRRSKSEAPTESTDGPTNQEQLDKMAADETPKKSEDGHKKKKKRPKSEVPVESTDGAATMATEEQLDRTAEDETPKRFEDGDKKKKKRRNAAALITKEGIDEMTTGDTPKKSGDTQKKKKKRPKEDPPTDGAAEAVAMTTEESLDQLLGELDEMTREEAEPKPTPDRDVPKKRSGQGKGKPRKKKTKTAETSAEGGAKKRRSKALEESEGHEQVDYQEETPDKASRQRKKSDDASDGLTPISPEKRSTSYHDLDKEDRKLFKEELQEGIKSELSAQDPANGGEKVEIDPNVRVKKTGVVIGKRKTNERPSIFEDEPSREVEENVLDEGKLAHRKLIMEADLSVVPETSPSLGLKHGHDKMDVVNRSLSKRRPASRRTKLLNSNKEALMGNERVDLSEQEDKQLPREQSSEKSVTSVTPSKSTEPAAAAVDLPQPRPRKQSIVEYMASLQKAKYSAAAKSTQGSSTLGVDLPKKIDENRNVSPSVAKRIFEGQKDSSPSPSRLVSEQQQGASGGGGRKTKTVEQPLKKLGIASEPVKATGSSHSAPDWVSIAQTKRDRNNSLHSDSTPTVESQPIKATPPKKEPQQLAPARQRREEEAIPKMGTVLDALARFQNMK